MCIRDRSQPHFALGRAGGLEIRFFGHEESFRAALLFGPVSVCGRGSCNLRLDADVSGWIRRSWEMGRGLQHFHFLSPSSRRTIPRRMDVELALLERGAHDL